MNLEGVPQIFEDGYYGFTNAHVLDYTYAMDAITISVGLEAANGTDASNATALAKVQYSGDFGTVGIVGEFSEGEINDAYKAYATLDLSEFVPGGILGGFYMWQDDITPTDIGNSRLAGAESIWGLGFQMNLTDNIEFIAYHNNGDDNAADVDVNLTTIGLNWYPVSGLKVFSAYSFGDDVAGINAFAPSPAGSADGDELSYDQFLIGLRRNF